MFFCLIATERDDGLMATISRNPANCWPQLQTSMFLCLDVLPGKRVPQQKAVLGRKEVLVYMKSQSIGEYLRHSWFKPLIRADKAFQ